VGELTKDGKGKLGTANDQGQHAVLGHSFVVNNQNATLSTKDPNSSQENKTSALGNVVKHEFAHEANTVGNFGRNVNPLAAEFGGHDSNDGSLMYKQLGPVPLYDADAPIPAEWATDLQSQFNRKGETDQSDSGSVTCLDCSDPGPNKPNPK